MDFAGLAARLAQNSVQEKLTAQWIDRCLVRLSRVLDPLFRYTIGKSVLGIWRKR